MDISNCAGAMSPKHNDFEAKKMSVDNDTWSTDAANAVSDLFSDMDGFLTSFQQSQGLA